jgi:kynureninase
MSVHPSETLRKFASDDLQAVGDLDFALNMDRRDELREYRDQFHFPKRHIMDGHAAPAGDEDGAATDKKSDEPIRPAKAPSAATFRYFCGNSLGLQHVGVEGAVAQELTKWRDQAVEGHFMQPNPWFEVDDVLRADMATIVGAEVSEVVVMNTLTVNLHLLLAAMYKPVGARRKLLHEKFPFPSDMHAFVSHIESHGFSADEDVVEIGGDICTDGPAVIPTQVFLDAIEQYKDTAAVIVIGAVHFLTGQYFDIAAITAAAQRHGILVGVDCAHAVGNVPLQLHDWGVDFACWCTYKYLNAGPGNIGGAFVHAKHIDQGTDDGAAPPMHSQLKGWWGHSRKNRFSLHRTFDYSRGAAAMQMSNPGVLGMMALQPSLQLAAAIGMPRLRAKSLLLTGYLEALLALWLPHAIAVVSPADVAQRGAQLSVRILPNMVVAAQAKTAAYECGNDLDNDADLVQRQLVGLGFMCDNRPPDIIRLAPVPTYNSFEDVWRIADALRTLLKPCQ